jgi:hypothetical protein
VPPLPGLPPVPVTPPEETGVPPEPATPPEPLSLPPLPLPPDADPVVPPDPTCPPDPAGLSEVEEHAPTNVRTESATQILMWCSSLVSEKPRREISRCCQECLKRGTTWQEWSWSSIARTGRHGCDILSRDRARLGRRHRDDDGTCVQTGCWLACRCCSGPRVDLWTTSRARRRT